MKGSAIARVRSVEQLSIRYDSTPSLIKRTNDRPDDVRLVVGRDGRDDLHVAAARHVSRS